MSRAIDDALEQLRRHKGLQRVGKPVSVEQKTHVEIDVEVELPSRVRANKISSTGVRALETCTLIFPPDWPLSAPRPYLREDFPLNFPHINPHCPSCLVSPCIFEGSLDELLHRFGLDAIIDQLIIWLHAAAAGTLLDLAHGWEPTRRDRCPSTVIFSADRLSAIAPQDGTIYPVKANYISFNEGIYGILDPQLTFIEHPIFTQLNHDDHIGKWANGDTAAFIVRASYVNDAPQVIAQYSPETVLDLPTLIERAASLCINTDDLARILNNHYRASVLNAQQDPRSWTHGLYVIVVLVAQRPIPLVGSPGRSVEVMPYVVHYKINQDKLFDQIAAVHAAFHSHSLSPELLARASGISTGSISHSIVMIGCGSLGSKIGMHLGRAGFGCITFLDNETLSPHNAARYGLSEPINLAAPPKKALRMHATFSALSHTKVRSFDHDATDLFTKPSLFADVVPVTAALIIDTTASLQVLSAETQSSSLDTSHTRLLRIVLYGQGRCAVLLLEGPGRACRVDDLNAFVFDKCRTDIILQKSIAGDTREPTRVFVGDNCSSLTMPMSDAVISRSAALAGIQIERWLVEGIPDSAVICAGVADVNGIGMVWETLTPGSTVVINVADDNGWTIRVLDHVVQMIQVDALKWGRIETGGALLGRICYESRVITIGGIVEAPPDSLREPTRFILGTERLIQNLRDANRNSLGYLAFIGTWHSHPQGGVHSGIDRVTLHKIAEEAGGLPAVSLVWTPTGLSCVVDRW